MISRYDGFKKKHKKELNYSHLEEHYLPYIKENNRIKVVHNNFVKSKINRSHSSPCTNILFINNNTPVNFVNSNNKNKKNKNENKIMDNILNENNSNESSARSNTTTTTTTTINTQSPSTPYYLSSRPLTTSNTNNNENYQLITFKDLVNYGVNAEKYIFIYYYYYNINRLKSKRCSDIRIGSDSIFYKLPPPCNNPEGLIFPIEMILKYYMLRDDKGGLWLNKNYEVGKAIDFIDNEYWLFDENILTEIVYKIII